MSTKGYHLFHSSGEGHVATLCDSCAVKRADAIGEAGLDFEPVWQCESDSPEHCEDCDALLDHGLTPDGYEYVAEYLRDALDSGVMTNVELEWLNEWGGILREDGYLTDPELNSLAQDVRVRDVG